MALGINERWDGQAEAMCPYGGDEWATPQQRGARPPPGLSWIDVVREGKVAAEDEKQERPGGPGSNKVTECAQPHRASDP